MMVTRSLAVAVVGSGILKTIYRFAFCLEERSCSANVAFVGSKC